MKNLPTPAHIFADLWGIHHFRQNLYQEAMSLDNVGSLRRICSRGYMSSLLFQKEIQALYDRMKSSLVDGDIRRKIEQFSPPSFFSPKDDRLSVAHIIRNYESKTIKSYQGLISKMSLSKDDIHLLTDHLYKLKDLHRELFKELARSYEILNPLTLKFQD